MKTLVLVHGNLILGMARQLLATRQWPADEIVWVTDRRYTLPPEDRPVLDISHLDLPPFRFKEAARLKSFFQATRSDLMQLDELLNGLQSEFRVVLPHLRSFKYHAMVTHPACRGFYLLEEGKLSYTRGIIWPDNWKHRLKTVILKQLYAFYLQGRVPPFPPDFDDQHPKFLGAFATSELAFPGIAQVERISIPFKKDPALEYYERVLVFGPYAEYEELPLAVQLAGIRALFEYFTRQSITQVHFKFHPKQLAVGTSPAAIRQLMAEYATSIRFDEIPAPVSLENIAASAPVEFYLATSSTAIYAVAMGRKVHSYAPYLIKLHPGFQQVLDDLPEVIRREMSWLELD